MKKNVGIVDKTVRIIIAVLLGIWGLFYASGVLMVVLLVLAAMLLVTALTGACLLYDLIGINTNK